MMWVLEIELRLSVRLLPRLRTNLSPESLSLRSVICENAAALVVRNMAIYLFINWLDLLVHSIYKFTSVNIPQQRVSLVMQIGLVSI